MFLAYLRSQLNSQFWRHITGGRTLLPITISQRKKRWQTQG